MILAVNLGVSNVGSRHSTFFGVGWVSSARSPMLYYQSILNLINFIYSVPVSIDASVSLQGSSQLISETPGYSEIGFDVRCESYNMILTVVNMP